MNWRLFRDGVWRRKREYAQLAAVAGVFWFGDAINPHTALAFSLAFAGIAPLGMHQALALREVKVLPLSRRTIWRTGWWIGVLLVVGFVPAAQLFAMMLGSRIDSQSGLRLQTIAIATILGFANTGPLSSLVPFIGVKNSWRNTRPAPVRLILTIGILLTVVGMLVWPFVMRRALPLTWDEFTPATVALVIAGSALAVRSYFTTRSVPVSPAHQAASPKPQKPVTDRPSRVGGIRFLLMQTWMKATLTQILIPAIIIGAGVVGSRFTGSGTDGGWRAELTDFAFRPFETGRSQPHDFIGFYLLGSFVFVWNSILPADLLLSGLRHFRTLPMGVRQLNGLLLSLPVLGWINLWMLLLGLHAVVSDQPLVSLQLPALVALIGGDALVRSLRLKATRLFGNVLLFGMAFVVSTVASREFVAIPLIAGVAAFATAWALNLRTLATNRTIYRPAPAATQSAL